MPWTYTISTGALTHNGALVGHGYSGHGEGLNNPAMCHVAMVGPVPPGTYIVGDPHTPPDHLGPLAMLLTPNPTNEMHARSGIFIHGDNARLNHSASDGCVILPHDVRATVAASQDRVLIVEA